MVVSRPRALWSKPCSELPPLRHRKEDIPELVDFFVERYSLCSISFDWDAMATLIKYTFPGNVKELEHIIQGTVTLARGNVIKPEDLEREVAALRHMEKIRGELRQGRKFIILW